MPDTKMNVQTGGNGEITDYLHADFDDLIFERRNKEYGAYILRKRYPARLSISTILAIGLFLTGIFAPDIFRLLSGFSAEEERLVSTEVSLTEPPPSDEELPLPPSPPPPAAAQPKPLPKPDLPQKVKKDEEVAKEPVPPSNQELENADTTSETNDEQQAKPSENEPKNDPPASKPEQPLTAVLEQMPAFPSGQDSLFRYLYRNIQYPAAAREKGLEGLVIVKFIVEKDGSISNEEAVNDIGGGCAPAL